MCLRSLQGRILCIPSYNLGILLLDYILQVGDLHLQRVESGLPLVSHYKAAQGLEGFLGREERWGSHEGLGSSPCMMSGMWPCVMTSSPRRSGDGTENSSEVGGILTTAHQEFGGCTHRCVGKPKHREQDRASPRRRGCARLGTAEEQLSKSDDFCWVQARRWTPSCVHYMSRALSKARKCRQKHQGRA